MDFSVMKLSELIRNENSDSDTDSDMDKDDPLVENKFYDNYRLTEPEYVGENEKYVAAFTSEENKPLNKQYIPKTESQRNREYCEVWNAQMVKTKPKPACKSTVQRSREYRARKRAEKDKTYSPPIPKTNAQRCREYRQRLKAKEQNKEYSFEKKKK